MEKEEGEMGEGNSWAEGEEREDEKEEEAAWEGRKKRGGGREKVKVGALGLGMLWVI